MRKAHRKGDTKAYVDTSAGRAAAGKSNFETGDEKKDTLAFWSLKSAQRTTFAD